MTPAFGAHDIIAYLGINDTNFSRKLDAVNARTQATANTMNKALKVGLLAGAAAFATSVIAATKYEKKMQEVGSLLGHQNKDQLEKYKKQLLEVSKSYPLDIVDDFGDGLYQIVSATVPLNKQMQTLELSSRAAIAGVAGLTDTFNLGSSIIKGYGFEWDQLDKVYDVVFRTIKEGQCVTGDTLIHNPDGSFTRIDELCPDENIPKKDTPSKNTINTITFDGEKFVKSKAHWWYRGEKEIRILTTSSGRKIKTTKEHPYLTPSGWTKVEKLNAGDYIAVPAQLEYFGKDKVQPEYAELCGMLLGDGSIGDGGNITPRLHLAEENLINRSIEMGKKIGLSPVYNKNNPNKVGNVSLRKHTKRGCNDKNHFTEWLKENGFIGSNQKCHVKHFPKCVWKWDKESLRLLLVGLFATDGWLSILETAKHKNRRGSDSYKIGINSSSEQLINDIQTALLRFNICSTFRFRMQKYEYKGVKKESPQWQLVVGSGYNIRLFFQEIGFKTKYPEKQQRAEEGLKWIPYEVNRIGQATLDKIKSIEIAPAEKVYDLTVDHVESNFIANNIIAHNTTMSELASSLGGAIPIAAQMGVSFQEVAGATATLAGVTGTTSEAVTQITGLMAALLKPTADLEDAYKRLGVAGGKELIETSGGLAGALEKIKSEAEKTEGGIGKLIGRKEALVGYFTLSGSLAEDFANKTEKMRESWEKGGDAQEAFEIQMESLANQLELLKNIFHSTFIEMGSNFLPKINQIVKIFTDSPAVVSTLITSLATLAITLGSVSAAIKIVTLVANMNPLVLAITAITTATVALHTAMNAKRDAELKEIDLISDKALEVSALTDKYNSLIEAEPTLASRRELKDVTEKIAKAYGITAEQVQNLVDKEGKLNDVWRERKIKELKDEYEKLTQVTKTLGQQSLDTADQRKRAGLETEKETELYSLLNEDVNKYVETLSAEERAVWDSGNATSALNPKLEALRKEIKELEAQQKTNNKETQINIDKINKQAEEAEKAALAAEKLAEQQKIAAEKAKYHAEQMKSLETPIGDVRTKMVGFIDSVKEGNDSKTFSWIEIGIKKYGEWGAAAVQVAKDMHLFGEGNSKAAIAGNYLLDSLQSVLTGGLNPVSLAIGGVTTLFSLFSAEQEKMIMDVPRLAEKVRGLQTDISDLNSFVDKLGSSFNSNLINSLTNMLETTVNEMENATTSSFNYLYEKAEGLKTELQSLLSTFEFSFDIQEALASADDLIEQVNQVFETLGSGADYTGINTLIQEQIAMLTDLMNTVDPASNAYRNMRDAIFELTNLMSLYNEGVESGTEAVRANILALLEQQNAANPASDAYTNLKETLDLLLESYDAHGDVDIISLIENQIAALEAEILTYQQFLPYLDETSQDYLDMTDAIERMQNMLAEYQNTLSDLTSLQITSNETTRNFKTQLTGIGNEAERTGKNLGQVNEVAKETNNIFNDNNQILKDLDDTYKSTHTTLGEVNRRFTEENNIIDHSLLQSLSDMREGLIDTKGATDEIATSTTNYADALGAVWQFLSAMDTVVDSAIQNLAGFNAAVLEANDILDQLAYFQIDLDTTDADDNIRKLIKQMRAYLDTLSPDSQAYRDVLSAIQNLTLRLNMLGKPIDNPFRNLPQQAQNAANQANKNMGGLGGSSYESGGYIPAAKEGALFNEIPKFANGGMLALLHPPEAVIKPETTKMYTPDQWNAFNKTGNPNVFGNTKQDINVVVENPAPNTRVRINDRDVEIDQVIYPRIKFNERYREISRHPYEK